MGGGLLQLVAQGAQDINLTGQPQISFFKANYKRHTNFATQWVPQSMNGDPKQGIESTKIQISRNGDLVQENVPHCQNQGHRDKQCLHCLHG